MREVVLGVCAIGLVACATEQETNCLDGPDSAIEARIVDCRTAMNASGRNAELEATLKILEERQARIKAQAEAQAKAQADAQAEAEAEAEAEAMANAHAEATDAKSARIRELENKDVGKVNAALFFIKARGSQHPEHKAWADVIKADGVTYEMTEVAPIFVQTNQGKRPGSAILYETYSPKTDVTACFRAAGYQAVLGNVGTVLPTLRIFPCDKKGEQDYQLWRMKFRVYPMKGSQIADYL